ncbi:CoA pyrophosphatase [Maritalea sp. S77]|uniref:CoA pyrophosphatase n=1 Tax=Maritalea sp. S77 TaxID=3415125 RepID=UPI003C7AD73B
MQDETLLAQIKHRLLDQPDGSKDIGCHKVDGVPPLHAKRDPKPSAVLIGLVERGPLSHVLYIERSSHLRAHAGQIAFPGGRVEEGDRDPVMTALREAEEEVDLNQDDVDVLGFLPNYLSGTNYLITPVVATIKPRKPFVANPDEVASFFEVPLPHLIPANHYSKIRFVRGDEAQRETWRIDYQDRAIWGITASMTRMFRDLVLTSKEDE